ncbi:MAG: ABC transporter permease subunit [Anaerolineae bacterium]|nr:MAG: ABC transporter permease subunit [Anaerolineae bacterium]
MMTIFRYTLRRFRGQILGWGIALALLAVLLISMYDSFAGEFDQFAELLELYPTEITAFIGDITSMATPEGWVSVEFFSYMPLILGIFGVLMGSGLLVSDEESGTLDLIMAHPVSRTALFMGRLLAFVTAAVAILVIVWLGFIVSMTWSSIDIGWGTMWLPLLSLLADLLLFGTMSLFLSMLLPSRRLAATTAGQLLVASFFITGLAKLNEDLEPVAKLSPLNYYQAQDAFHALNGAWLAGLLAAAVLFAALAWWRFQRRDIRVGGEGGWRLPALPFRRGAEAR